MKKFSFICPNVFPITMQGINLELLLSRNDEFVKMCEFMVHTDIYCIVHILYNVNVRKSFKI